MAPETRGIEPWRRQGWLRRFDTSWVRRGHAVSLSLAVLMLFARATSVALHYPMADHPGARQRRPRRLAGRDRLERGPAGIEGRYREGCSACRSRRWRPVTRCRRSGWLRQRHRCHGGGPAGHAAGSVAGGPSARPRRAAPFPTIVAARFSSPAQFDLAVRVPARMRARNRCICAWRFRPGSGG